MSDATEVEPRILPRSEHPISRKNISENTLKVLYRLHGAGHKAYLVGGGVRDLMLGREPKDFDVGTSARTHEIRKLFRNSRIIGRRFRLAHVYFKGEVVEVSTFRRTPAPEEQDSADDELLITSDNTWGTPQEDAFRRDFTVNALFYNIGDYSVIDYVGGIDDLRRGIVRAIGDPDVRFQEDPVRMLRACEFAGRLGFTIESRTQEGIRQQKRELLKASTARLTEEIIQLMRCGHAGRAMQWMIELDLTEVILPEVAAMLAAGKRGLGDLSATLPAVDRLIAEGREPSDVALLAILVLPEVLVRREEIEAGRDRPLSRGALDRLTRETLAPFLKRFSISKTRSEQMIYAVTGFLRLCEPGWEEKRRIRFAARPYFDDALVLFEILVRATGEGEEALAAWRRAGELRRKTERAKGAPRGRGPRRPQRHRRRRRRR